jgi:magnesium transporter
LFHYHRWEGGRVERPPDFGREQLDGHPGAVHWIDLEEPTAEEARVLADVFHFHPLAIEDCLSDVNYPKTDDYGDYLYVIVHGIRFDVPSDSFVTRELDIFLGPNYVVTHHKGPVRSITATREQCQKGGVIPLQRGADFLVHHILDQLFDNYFPSLDAIEDKIQMIEVEVFENPGRETLDRVFSLKRDVMHLRRICAPQRELVHRLSRGEFTLIGDKAAIYFRDIYDHLYRIVEASYSYQDMSQGLLDAYLSAVSNRLNETMKRLTVIGALLMPLTLITGIYGMNFEHMPELHWHYGYPMVLGMMALTILVLAAFLKKKDWI